MRFNIPITFVKYTDSYDASTGDYNTTSHSTLRYADVTPTSEQMMTLVYGGVRQDSVTARLQNRYTGDFDEILIDGKAYRVDYRRPLSVKDVFVLTRV